MYDQSRKVGKLILAYKYFISLKTIYVLRLFCLYVHLHSPDSDLFKVFNLTFNNISVISRRSVLLVEETGVPSGDRH